MCGIIGVFSPHKETSIEMAEAVKRACSLLIHRGPDDQQVYRSMKWPVIFGHCRLKILDMTSCGAQPMIERFGECVTTYNGEIYNHLELRQEMFRFEYPYASSTDTETLLALYKHYGISFLNKTEGMFAFALLDEKTGQGYLVRDRFGIKPLYFTLQGGMISFSSEIKALWALPWVSRKIRKETLSYALTALSIPAPFTLYEDIYKLPPGFYMSINPKGEISFHEWYVLHEHIRQPYTYEVPCFQEAVEECFSLLDSSVKRRLVSDVPVGILLSGGLDSSLIAALMTRHSSRISTFTVSIKEDTESEQAQAKKMANLLGAAHHSIVIDEQDAASSFYSMLYHLDEPVTDPVSLPYYYICRLASQKYNKVLLVGEGADELFWGYPLYARYSSLISLLKFLSPIKPIASHLIQATHPLTKKPVLDDVLQAWAVKRPMFIGGAVAFGEEQIKAPFLHLAEDEIAQKIYKGIEGSTLRDILAYHLKKASISENSDLSLYFSYIELKHRLPELLFMRTDKMSMATSIEARLPFLDHKLVEFVLSLPMEYKNYKGITKRILRAVAEKVLPAEVVERKKVGFGVPLDEWIKNGYTIPHLVTSSLPESARTKDLSPAQKWTATVIRSYLSSSEKEIWESIM